MRYIDEAVSSEGNSPRTSRLVEKLIKLESYQVEDLIHMLTHKRYSHPGRRSYTPSLSPSKTDARGSPVLNALGLVSFIFIMNDIIRDWMLVEAKRPKKPEPVIVEPVCSRSEAGPPKKMSMMEQRLLGSSFLAE